MNNLKIEKQKSGGTHAFFEKDSYLSVSEWKSKTNCSIVRGSPQKTLILNWYYLSYVSSKSTKKIPL